MSESETNITVQFLDGIYEIIDETIPQNAIKKVKECLLDYIGVVFAGEKDLRDRELDFLHNLEEDKAKGIIFGSAKKPSTLTSIFVNGMNSHALELDDGSRYGVAHSGGPIFSVLLTIALQKGIEWRRLMMALLVAYEASIRISYSIQPGHYAKGYHPTATCVPLGISMGMGVLLGLDKDTIKNAFSFAALSAGGSLKSISDTSQLKVCNAGRAASLGYMSVMLAMSGFNGPSDVLGGDMGFLNIMSNTFHRERLLREPKEKLKILDVYNKLYASCRHTHGVVEAALAIRKKHNLNLQEIDRIIVNIYKGVVGKHDIYEIFGEESAKMSIPYSIAATLTLGHANGEAFKVPNLFDPNILGLVPRVQIIEDEYFTSLLPNKRMTKLSILMKNKSYFEETVEFPKGEPENPLSKEELKRKYVSLMDYAGIDSSTIDSIYKSIFEKSDVDTNKLYKLLSNQHGRHS